MSASEPSELPQQPPEVVYRRPAWVEPPADLVPGIVPVELILARTPQRAIGLSGIRAYPTGFDFDLAVRRHPGQPRRHGGTCGRTSSAWRSASPTAAAPTTAPAPGPTPTTTGRLTRRCSTRASAAPDGGHVWLWGLPPPGPLTFACHWPAEQIPPSQAALDAGLVLAAAARAQTLWPDPSPP